MKAVKYLFLLALVVGLMPQSQAQFRYKYISLGASVGSTNYLGDLDDDFTFKYSRLGFDFNVKYRLNPFISARLGAFHGWARATDSISSDPARNRRNLSFRTPITDVSAVFVFDFIPNGRRFNYRPPYTPYVFGGVSLFRFNPQAPLGNDWIPLQPLGTEGQQTGLADYSDPYSLVQVAIPMGAGVRIKLADQWDLEIETGFRKTFTDYLDDVSSQYVDPADLDLLDPLARQLQDRIDRDQYPQGAKAVNGIRGDNEQLDWYIYTAVRINYILDWVRCPKF